MVACVLPVMSLLVIALAGLGGGFGLDGRQWRLLGNTALLGAGTALLASIIGAPLGLVVARASVPYKAAIRLALAAPLLMPPYVVALAWTYLGGRGGLLAALTGYDRVSAWIYSVPMAVMVLGLVFYPLVMLATEVALRRVDGRLEEAALTVATPRRVLWRISAPLVAPSVLASALIVFVLAVSEFGVPGVLRVRVYTTEIFTAFAALYDSGRAARLALPLLALCLLVTLVATAVLGDRLVSARRATDTPAAMLFTRVLWPLLPLLAVLGMSLVLPLGLLGREALGVQSAGAVIAGSGEATVNSLRLSTLGASVIVGVAAWLGVVRARMGALSGRTVDVLLVVLFAVPSTMVGVGLISIWNRPGLLGALYGTDGMLIVAYVARLLPMTVLALAASARSVAVSQEEAAAVSGAGWFSTIAHIVVPQMRMALVATWVIVFVLAFGELGVSLLVAPPGETTLPIRVYTIIANAPASTVASLALLQASVILMPLIVLGAYLARREAQ